MEQQIRRLYQMLILLSVIIVLFIAAFANPYIYDTTDFSLVNARWNGCSDIAVRTVQEGKLQPTFYFEDNELSLAYRSFTAYDTDPNSTCLILIGPRTAFTTEEISYVQEFLTQGGMMLLADDFGTGNQLLTGINASIRLSERLLLDLAFEKQAPFVNVFSFDNTSSPLLANVSNLLLNYPTRILTTKNATVLAKTTELSWEEKNQNGRLDTNEQQGSYPVLAQQQYGKGILVVVSDPSLFINDMHQYLDNQQFRDNLFHFLYKGRSTVIIDESHRDFSAPLQLLYRLPQTLSQEIKIGIVILVLVIFLLVFTTLPGYLLSTIMKKLFKPPSIKEMTVDEQVDAIMKKHPDWNRKKLKDLLQRMKT